MTHITASSEMARADDTKRNMYEIERDDFYAIATSMYGVVNDILGPGPCSIVRDYISPHVCAEHPYKEEMRAWSLAICNLAFTPLNFSICAIIAEYAQPNILLSEPIPCAITTIGKIPNFDYDQKTLIEAIKSRGEAGLVDPRILAVANTKGSYLRPGIPDPRQKTKNKHGRPAKPAKSGNSLFGTSQTTFWVQTEYRDPGKVFAVKVFQNSVSFETLGGLWDDCRDTRDVNETALAEIRASLGNPGLQLTGFCASMRNYRFRLLSGQHINLFHVFEIFKQMRETTHPYIFCEIDVSRYPALLIEIDVANHTSKKKRLVTKVFQSGKINLDSCVFPEHVTVWYKFMNDFFIAHPEVLYYPTDDDEYDSDHYYEQEGVEPPARELVDC